MTLRCMYERSYTYKTTCIKHNYFHSLLFSNRFFCRVRKNKLFDKIFEKQLVKEVLLLRLRRLIRTRVVVNDVHNFGLVCHLATGLYYYSLLPSTTIRKTIWRKVVSRSLENLSHQNDIQERGKEEWIQEKAIEKWQLNVLYHSIRGYHA